MCATKEPVTMGGWYELTDGRVRRFRWNNGQIVTCETVDSWADVTTDDPFDITMNYWMEGPTVGAQLKKRGRENGR